MGPAIPETQRSGGITAFVDAEHAFDPTYAKGLGIKNEDLLKEAFLLKFLRLA